MKLTMQGISERVASFEAAVISHTIFQGARDSIALLHARSSLECKIKRKARALLVLGEAGSGKTTLLEHYASLYPDIVTPDGDIRPIVRLEAPKKTTPKQLAAAILGALSPGWRVIDGWNTDRILREIAFFCDEMGVAILMIDEAHHIMDHAGESAREDAAEFIKSLLNRSGAQIVLAGLPHLAHLPKTNRLRQLRRRFEPKVWLRPYNWSSRKGRLEYLELLMAFEDLFGLPEPSQLTDFDIASRIYCATGGEPGIISKHLGEGLRIALQRSHSKIDVVLLGEVFERFELEDREQPLLMFDAEPSDDAEPVVSSENPYLAQSDAFRALWSAMAAGRGSDASPTTRHKKHASKEASVFSRA